LVHVPVSVKKLKIYFYILVISKHTEKEFVFCNSKKVYFYKKNCMLKANTLSSELTNRLSSSDRYFHTN
jgi:hypothetical protein